MKKVLWISPFAPYDTVGHAGGKNHNYYLKYFASKKIFDIKLLSICSLDEINGIDLNRYKIRNDIFCMCDKGIYTIIKMIINAKSAINPFNKYHNMPPGYRRICFQKLLKRNITDIANADIIILHWTQSLFMYPLIRRYTKNNVKFIAIEEDVSYLGYQRKYEASSNIFIKLYWKIQYTELRKKEIDLLGKCKLVITTNRKDLLLLENAGISADILLGINSYYDNYSKVERDDIDKHMILYYGAMGRKENYSAAIWFAKKVLPLLDEQFYFVVIGSQPDKKLLNLKSKRVIIKGFVENVNEYFSRCLCLAAPLLLGAGIKIKVLEAMSAGIPVLTNEIGIEGIGASDGEQYLHCEVEEEYALKIQLLSENKISGYDLGQNAKKFIQNNFDMQKSAAIFMNCLEHM